MISELIIIVNYKLVKSNLSKYTEFYMDREQLQEDLSIQLLHASLRGKFEISRAVESYELTFMQAAVLCLLSPGKPLPMSALSDFLGCTPSYVTGIVEQLVNGAFVVREEWSEDRRVKAISLAPQGEALRAKLLSIAVKAWLPNVEALSSAELRIATETIGKAVPDAQSFFRALKSPKN